MIRGIKPTAAARAISHLITVRDQLELAGRPPGEFVAISRDAMDSILNDLGVVARLIRELAEGGARKPHPKFHSSGISAPAAVVRQMIQAIRKVEVVTNIVKQEATAVDSFAGWDDSTEGQERSEGAGLIQGTLLKFSNSATWITRDDDVIEPTLELVAVEVLRVVQKWCDGKPVETKILGPGEKFPDIDAMNEAIPRDQWVSAVSLK